MKSKDWRVLFVGGDTLWSRQIEHDLLRLVPNWRCEHARTCDQALAALSSEPAHALVLDARVGGADKFLEAVAARFPGTIPVVRCQAWDRAAVAQWTNRGVGLVPDCADAAALVASVNKAARLHGWKMDPAIRRLLGLVRKLPTVPRLYAEVTEKLQSPESSIEAVAHLISQDPVMTAKILQAVNSAMFGLACEITSPVQAVLLLGSERTCALILLAGVFTQFDDIQCPGFSPDAIWLHSLQTAWFTRTIASAEITDPRSIEAAFTAGLLHNVGKLMLAGNVPDLYTQVLQAQARRQCPLQDAELEVLGATHAELGASLLGNWGLALPILESVAWHHCPSRSQDSSFSLLTAVHTANAFAHWGEGGKTQDPVAGRLDTQYLSRIGLGSRLDDWRQRCNVPA